MKKLTLKEYAEMIRPYLRGDLRYCFVEAGDGIFFCDSPPVWSNYLEGWAVPDDYLELAQVGNVNNFDFTGSGVESQPDIYKALIIFIDKAAVAARMTT